MSLKSNDWYPYKDRHRLRNINTQKTEDDMAMEIEIEETKLQRQGTPKIAGSHQKPGGGKSLQWKCGPANTTISDF